MTFAIRPLVSGGATGSVTAAVSSAGVHYHLVVTGLAPGSTHTIHDHMGTCAAAGISVHLSVLSVATANSGGVIVVDTSVPSSEFGSGRIVIVYATASAQNIIGCASL